MFEGPMFDSTPAPAAPGRCVYCGAAVRHPAVPAPDDVDGWGEAAREHRLGCEWIATRAHTRMSNAGDRRQDVLLGDPRQ